MEEYTVVMVFAVMAAVASLLLVLSSLRSFSQRDKNRKELGPWSLLVAYFAALSGLSLFAFALCFISSPVMTPSTVIARVGLFELFLFSAQASIFNLPLVLLDFDASGLFVLRSTLGLSCAKFGEWLFHETIYAPLMFPVFSLIFFISLRLDWDRRRMQNRVVRDINHFVNVVSDRMREPFDVRSRRTASPAVMEAMFTSFNIEPVAAASPVSVVSLTSAPVLVLLAETVMLAALGMGCSEVWLFGGCALYAVTHGLLCARTLS